MPLSTEPYDYRPDNRLTWIIPRSYYYYDTPDGQDLLKKIFFLFTTVGKVGVGHGLLQCMVGHPEIKTTAEGVYRVYEYTKPYVFIPTIFATYVHFATNIREKDDIWNYTCGGALAGSYMGVWFNNSLRISTFSAGWCALIGTVYKYMQLRDYSFIGRNVPANYRCQTVRSLKGRSFSVVDERPRNWYTAEEVREKNIVLPQGKPGFCT